MNEQQTREPAGDYLLSSITGTPSDGGETLIVPVRPGAVAVPGPGFATDDDHVTLPGHVPPESREAPARDEEEEEAAAAVVVEVTTAEVVLDESQERERLQKLAALQAIRMNEDLERRAQLAETRIRQYQEERPTVHATIADDADAVAVATGEQGGEKVASATPSSPQTSQTSDHPSFCKRKRFILCFFALVALCAAAGAIISVCLVILGGEKEDENQTLDIFDTTSWDQLGQTLGKGSIEPGDEGFGGPVAVSADFTVMVTAGLKTRDGQTLGFIRAFRYVEATNEWHRMGQDIGNVRFFGLNNLHACALSANGLVLATANGAGRVTVFEYSSMSDRWDQVGQELGNGDASEYGYAVVLSKDGHVLAIGTPFHEEEGAKVGAVQVYRYTREKGEWVSSGNTVKGSTSPVDLSFGYSIAMSSNGDILAVGAPGGNDNGQTPGRVYVFKLNEGAWIQVGQILEGELINDRYGGSIALSGRGDILAIGANVAGQVSAGRVYVFRYDDETDMWTQRGTTKEGVSHRLDNLGFSVDISMDGSILAVGAPSNPLLISTPGHVRVYGYEEDETDWIQLGPNIDGEMGSENFGFSVAISANGNGVAVSSLSSQADLNHVRTFRARAGSQE